jgi:hypothetical protein
MEDGLQVNYPDEVEDLIGSGRYTLCVHRTDGMWGRRSLNWRKQFWGVLIASFYSARSHHLSGKHVRSKYEGRRVRNHGDTYLESGIATSRVYNR